MTNRTLGESATVYAARGLHIFPLGPRQKTPLTSSGFKAATTDAATLGAWWQRWPDANIGCTPGASGFVVLDLDGPEGEAAAARLGLLAEPTLEVQTGRLDGGRHLWFRHPGFRVGNAPLAAKLDVRADDGYVVLPPSVHPSGRGYRWRGRFADVAALPPRVLALLRDRAEPPRLQLHRDPVPGAIVEGARNQTLARLAGAWRRLGASDPVMLTGLEAINAAHVQPPLDPDEVAALVASIGRYRPPAATPPAQGGRSTRLNPTPLAGSWGRL